MKRKGDLHFNEKEIVSLSFWGILQPSLCQGLGYKDPVQCEFPLPGTGLYEHTVFTAPRLFPASPSASHLALSWCHPSQFSPTIPRQPFDWFEFSKLILGMFFTEAKYSNMECGSCIPHSSFYVFEVRISLCSFWIKLYVHINKLLARFASARYILAPSVNPMKSVEG